MDCPKLTVCNRINLKPDHTSGVVQQPLSCHLLSGMNPLRAWLMGKCSDLHYCSQISSGSSVELNKWTIVILYIGTFSVES